MSEQVGIPEIMEMIRNLNRSEIDNRMRELEEELTTLRALRKLVPSRQVAEETVPAPEADEDAESINDRIFDLLVNSSDEWTVSMIAEHLSLEPRRVGRAVNQCDWFTAPGVGGNRVVAVATVHPDTAADARDADVDVTPSPRTSGIMNDEAQRWLAERMEDLVEGQGPNTPENIARKITAQTQRVIEESQVALVVDLDRRFSYSGKRVILIKENT